LHSDFEHPAAAVRLFLEGNQEMMLSDHKEMMLSDHLYPDI
jgi:hypothetical protein